jgi:hypothetical protein
MRGFLNHQHDRVPTLFHYQGIYPYEQERECSILPGSIVHAHGLDNCLGTFVTMEG